MLKRIEKKVGLQKRMRLVCEKPRIRVGISGGNIASLGSQDMALWLA